MEEKNPACPQCASAFSYQDGALWVCPECGHEWSEVATVIEQAVLVRDASGNPLTTGDSVTLIKDLKVKGAAATVKTGTKVKNIRIVDPVDGHDIACKIDGIGAIYLKSEFVRKA